MENQHLINALIGGGFAILGWLYENGAFVDTTPPVEPMVVPKMPTLAEQILASPADLAALKQALGI